MTVIGKRWKDLSSLKTHAIIVSKEGRTEATCATMSFVKVATCIVKRIQAVLFTTSAH
jgi:hypothetical protein